jgi:hypothetical protein
MRDYPELRVGQAFTLPPGQQDTTEKNDDYFN